MDKDEAMQVIKLEDIEPVEMPPGFFLRLVTVVGGFSVGVIEGEPGSTFDVVHPEAEVVYCLRGRMEYDDGRILEAQEALVNLPNVPHSGRVGGDERAMFVEIKCPAPQRFYDMMEARKASDSK